ncbi:MAG: twin-arginine translocase subunit TatC [Alphaproteobacteria bacterium]|nr:twin-arginine translocase subunit TatC [Alphaproteobacteria bacterium]
MNEKHTAISEHFNELKKRVFYTLSFFLFSFVVSYIFSDDIYRFLLAPLSEYYKSTGKTGSIIYTGLTEAFFTYIKVAFISALFFTIPFIALQIFYFSSPGLKKGEKRVLIACFLATPLLFLTGAFVAYYFIFPEAWKFFLSFENSSLENLPIKLEARISEYLSLSSQIILAFGIAFQLPIAITLCNKIDLISIEWLKEKRRFAIVIIFVVAAVITPPDVVSQLALASIMILLYELSILLCIFLNNKNKKIDTDV